MQVTQPAAARRSTARFLAYALACIGMWLLHFVVFRVVKVDATERAFAAFELAWLLLTGVLVAGVFLLAGAVDRPARLWALAGVAITTTALSAMQTVLGLAGVELATNQMVLTVFGLVEAPLGVVERALLSWVLLDLAGATRRAWTVPVAVTGVLLALVRLVISLTFILGPALGVDVLAVVRSEAYPLVQAGLTIIGLALHLALTLGARAGVADTASEAPRAPASVSPPASDASTDFVIGGLLLVVGLAVTIGSFMVASSASGGGRYVVATGAIAVGVGRLIRGAVRASRS
jgi:hypothetical protein